jgi:hypothetical protein
MSNRLVVAACAVFASLSVSLTAVADDHPFTEGPVVNISRIRTEYGHFDDYMNYLDTTWKASQEAAKKAGYIVSYEVLTAQPRDPNDADIILVVTYKNWAALDGATAKGDAIAKAIEGSIAKSDQAAQDRLKIRRVLGSSTMQVLNLK